MTDDDELDPGADDAPEQTEPEPGTPDSAADQKRLKQQARRRELDKRESDDFWRGVFASPVGRREMWAILVAAGLKEPRFGAGPNGFPDPHASFFRAGVQSVATHLLDQWTAREFEGVYLMRCEHDPLFPKPKPADKKADR